MENKKDIKILLLSLPFAIIIALGLAHLMYKYPDTAKKVGIGMIIVSILFCTLDAMIESETTGGRSGGESSYGHSYEKKESSTEFRRPIGKVPVAWDPENRFYDYYGHEYHKLGGVWYDDEGNFAPDYMKGYYGLSDYEDRWRDDD